MNNNINEQSIITKLQNAFSELILLKMLTLKDVYGYQLTIEISNHTNGLIVYKEATIYNTLRMFKKQGYMSMYDIISERNQARIFYHLEGSGKEYFYKLKEEFSLFTETMNIYLGTMTGNCQDNNFQSSEHPFFLKMQRACHELILLRMLELKDMHGYQLVAEINNQSGGMLIYKEMTTYRILKTMREQGFISMQNAKSGKNGIKMIYHIEKSGEIYYEKIKKEFYLFSDTMDKFLSLT